MTTVENRNRAHPWLFNMFEITKHFTDWNFRDVWDVSAPTGQLADVAASKHVRKVTRTGQKEMSGDK